MTCELDELKNDVAEFMQRLYRQRLTTTSGGNISVRDGDNILITPSNTDKGTLKGSEVGVMSLEDGRIVGKTFKPSIESEIHLGIYRKCSDVNAVVHAHPVAASAFAASRAQIKTSYHAEASVIVGEVGLVDYLAPGSAELAEQVADVAVKFNCLLMRNHGALCVGDSLLQAFDRLEVLEAAAQVNLIMRGALINDAVELNRDELNALKCFV